MRKKFARKLKKGTKRSFRLSKELQERLGDLKNAMITVIEPTQYAAQHSQSPRVPAKVTEAKDKLSEAEGEYDEVIKLFGELDTLLIREAKWIRKGGLLRGDLAKGFKIGMREYTDLNKMREDFESRVKHDFRELKKDLSNNRFTDAADGAKAALEDIEDVEKGAKEVVARLAKMRKLALEGADELEDEE